MTLWMVRAGKYGQREQLALKENVAVIGWERLPDLTQVKSREKLSEILKKTYPDQKPKTLINWESQIWPFIGEMKKGDLVALPFKSRSVILIGEVTGDYQYRPDLPAESHHTRSMKWIGEYPRTAFDQDLLHSLGAFMTVCRIKRNNAEERIRAIMLGKAYKPAVPIPESPTNEDTEEAPLDIEQMARDQISEYLSRKFRGHNLANLVAAILIAQGYRVRISPEGPDGGVDIMAGQGMLGFDQPRLAVQVKSEENPIDIKVFHELQGVMKNFGADHGLLVAWGGYKSSVMREASRHYFEIRLWDAEDLVRMIQTNYDKLPEDIQAELPLKRIWALVQSEE